MDPAMIASVFDEPRSAGAVIRLARLARGLTQAQLGHLVGYSSSAISRIERSQLRVRDIVVLRRLAQALAISPEFVGVSTSVPRHAPYH
jgi:transcriptional regulator with XRE-family HTH domain